MKSSVDIKPSLTIDEVRQELARLRRLSESGIPSDREHRALALALTLQRHIDRLIERRSAKTADAEEPKLTDLAEKVMGWRVVTRQNGTVVAVMDDGESLTVLYRADGKPSLLSSWNPLENIADAWMVLGALMGRGLIARVSVNSSECDCEVLGPCGDGLTVETRGYAACKTATEAICRAALAATEGT